MTILRPLLHSACGILLSSALIGCSDSDEVAPASPDDGGAPDSAAADAALLDTAAADTVANDSPLPDSNASDSQAADSPPADATQSETGIADATSDVGADTGIADSPIALIYDGVGGCDGCHQAVAKALKKDVRSWQIQYVGPDDITASALAGATLYVQPGGDGNLSGLVGAIGSARGTLISNFVRAGGRYLGFCMGGFYASSYGIGLLPGPTPTWNDAKSDSFVPVSWRGSTRFLYYEGGFHVPQNVADAAGATVIARYGDDDKIAAIVAKVDAGALGLVGPHPEGSSWGDDPDGDDSHLVLDLLDATLGL
ncbi:MAG TPA: BPL-N domain-containing protein [Polyangiaceae bacterium]|nr:BPL-N domain-containing protein [Polyangiaceae bacterium]